MNPPPREDGPDLPGFLAAARWSLFIATLMSLCAATVSLQVQASGIDLAAMDRSVQAGEDFYRYANGRWLESTSIPPDRSRWGNFSRIEERVAGETRALIEHVDRASAAPDAVRAHDYYQAILDQDGIDARGVAPLQAALAQIELIQDAAALARALGAGVRADVDPLNDTHFATPNLLGLWVAPALNDTRHMLPYLLQGGLSLPDREFYVADSSRMSAIRARFLEHIRRMFALAGIADAGPRAQAVFDLEQDLAKGHVTRTDSEDVQKTRQVWSRQDLAARAPGLDWKLFLDAAGLADQSDIGVWHPDALVSAAHLVQEVPTAVWRDWLRLHLLDGLAPVLPRAFDDEHFAMYGTGLTGVPTQRERWKRALAATNAALPDAVGRLYVEHAFPASSKQRVQAMVQRIVSAFDQRIARLAWMEPQTRSEARAKLRKLIVGVGYPEHWHSYADLEVRQDDPVGNQLRAGLFHRTAELARLQAPVDRNEWCMAAQTVNAVNLPLQNALNFPAAILQPPFFDPTAADALNYGAIGTIIGHEISHSFDDQGAQFDADGTLRNWWTDQDLAHFSAVSASLARQFSAYRPFADAAVDGRLTLSENIADIGGLAAAYDAFHSLPQSGTRAARGRLGADQEFFIAFAQAWQVLEREQQLRQQLVVDSHAPAPYRVATVRNLDGWYRAFGVHRGQTLYLAPKDRAAVW